MVTTIPLHKGLQKSIDLIGKHLCVDPEYKEIAEKEVPYWNTTLLALSYVLDQHPLIVGEPGFAKTTMAKVVSSVLTGYPFDLYEAAQIQGHPDQTYETMIARLDFSQLTREERVIWLTSAYLPVRITDEINRLPTGKQDELLNAIETGRFNYLNATFFTGKAPFFTTANHPDDGNHIMIPPLRDRFPIHVELGYIGASYEDQIRDAQNNILELRDDGLTTKILEIINNPGKSIHDKLKEIDINRKQFVQKLEGVTIDAYIVDLEKKKAMQQQIYAVPETTEATVFRQMLNAELNTTPTYGRKRSNDPVDASNHAKDLASTACKNGFSPRGVTAIREYVQALAWLTADDPARAEVTKAHIVAIAPHVLGHRLEFTQDYRAEWEGKQRDGIYGTPMEMFLSQQLVCGVEKRYGTLKQDLDLVVTACKKSASLTADQLGRVNAMILAPDMVDHPLVREYVLRIKHNR